MDYSDWLKIKGLEYINNQLYFCGMNTIDIAKRYGTPIYVISEDIIRQRYKALKEALNKEYSNNSIHYAVKANSNLAFLKILESEGASVDCVSTGEIHLCSKAGFSHERIIYTSNNITNDELRYALQKKVIINLDHTCQVQRLVNMADEVGYKPELLSFRINPEFGGGHHDHCITAGRHIKFGILEENIVDAYKTAIDNGFTRFGAHIHIGSGILEMDPFINATEKYLSIVKKVRKELKIDFEFIDFGGGLGIPYRPTENPLDLSQYASTVLSRFKSAVEEMGLSDPKFIIEPGRYLSAEASIILTEANTIKKTRDKNFVGTNGGFQILIRPTMYGSYHHIINCDTSRKDKKIHADIVGQLCESGDVIGRDRDIIEPKEGEFLAILDAGAYGFTMGSEYNSRPRPAEILISGVNTYIVREAGSFEDLDRHQKIPDHLLK
jgi:diaminopimelate decarboxylase